MASRFLSFVVLISLAATACSASATSVTLEAGEAPRESAVPDAVSNLDFAPPEGGQFANTVREYCEQTGDPGIEMRFRATVSHVDNTGPAPWTTFAVSEWFTTDIGTWVGLWSPGFAGQAGDEWLVASSRYPVGNQTSGDVYWCESEPFSDTVYETWTTRYGATAVAGADEAETPMERRAAAVLVENEARWRDNKPSSYTYAVRVYSNFGDGLVGRCGNGHVRVAVENGEVLQARSLPMGCDVHPEDVPRLEDLFDLARRAAGAAEGNIEYSTEFGFLRELSAADRSIQVSVHVSSFDVGAFPLSEDPLAELGDKRAQWERTGPSSYTWALEMRCFCAIDGPIQLSVIDRQPNPRQELGAQTVEQLFDIIEQSGGADSLQVAYHPDLGYPIEIRIDRYFNGSDDEIDYFVRNLIAR